MGKLSAFGAVHLRIVCVSGRPLTIGTVRSHLGLVFALAQDFLGFLCGNGLVALGVAQVRSFTKTMTGGARVAAAGRAPFIGLEIAGAQALYPDRGTVALAASGPLRDLYLLALAEAGFTTSEADADAAVRKGLLAAARYCFGTFKD